MLQFGTYDVLPVGSAALTKRVEYTCISCGAQSTRKIVQVLDNAGAKFASAVCRCSRRALFTDNYGNYKQL